MLWSAVEISVAQEHRKWWQGAGAGAVCSDHSEEEDEAALCSAPSSSTNPVFSP